MSGQFDKCMKSFSPEMREKLFLSAALLLFYVLVSYPILCAGYYHDDSVDSLIKGRLVLAHMTLWQYTEDWVVGTMMKAGRIYPLAYLFHWPLNYYFHNPASYQAVRVLMIFCSMLPWGWFLTLLTGKREAGLAFLFFIPFFWSIHIFFDPLPSFGLILPLVTGFAGLTFCFFIKAEQTGRRWWHMWGALACAGALLSYEIGIAVCPAVMIFAWVRRRNIRTFIVDIWPYVLMNVLYLITVYISRKYAVGIYDGIQPGEFQPFLITFAKQLTGTLPLSNYLFGHQPKKVLYHLSNAWRIKTLETVATILLFPLATVCYFRWLPKLKLPNKTSYGLLGAGACLLIIPAALLGLSRKYQGLPPYQEFSLFWGVSYQPVYLQYIGLALMCFVGIAKGLEKVPPAKKKLTIGLLAVFLSAVTSITVIFNHQVIIRENEAWQDPRYLVQSALKRGLLTAVVPMNDGVTIIAKHAVWHTPTFFIERVGMNPKTLDIDQPDQFLPKDSPASGVSPVTDKPSYLLDYESFPNSSSGFVVFGKIKTVRYTAQDGKRQIKGFVLQDTRVFIREEPGVYFINILKLLEDRLPSESNRTALYETLSHTIVGGKNWTLVQFPPGQDQSWNFYR